MQKNQAIVSVHWLQEHMLDDNLIILNASLNKDKTGQIVYSDSYGIPNSIPFNISDVFSDQTSAYPNMLTDVSTFEKEVSAFGINSTSTIVIYDTKGIYSSPRAWWMFKLMGHSHVYVLNGGLPAWKALNYPVTKRIHIKRERGDFIAKPNFNMVWNYNQVKENIKTNTHQIIDARSEDRFLGLRPEPRKQTRSGHIEHSLNLHYSKVLTNGFLKPEAELKTIFKTLNIGRKPIVFSCGSGVTACILYLTAYLYLDHKLAVYDGSWTEWGERTDE